MKWLKTLVLDIETSPNLADVWGLWQQNVSLSQLRESSYTLCWAAKWLGQKEMFFGAEWEDFDNIELVYELLDEADATVTYNGDSFDLPTLNKDFLLAGYPPPSPYRSIDIYKDVKRRFRFPSNKLAYVAKRLGVGEKLDHEGHELWVKVMAGDKKAQAKMTKYCKQDVTILEGVHDKILPWIADYPNRALYSGLLCVRCTSGVLQRRGFSYTQTGKYQVYRCTSCGGQQRDTRRIEGVSVRSI